MKVAVNNAVNTWWFRELSVSSEIIKDFEKPGLGFGAPCKTTTFVAVTIMFFPRRKQT